MESADREQTARGLAVRLQLLLLGGVTEGGYFAVDVVDYTVDVGGDFTIYQEALIDRVYFYVRDSKELIERVEFDMLVMGFGSVFSEFIEILSVDFGLESAVRLEVAFIDFEEAAVENGYQSVVTINVHILK